MSGEDIALLEPADEQATEHVLNNELRSLPWWPNSRSVMPHHTILGPLAVS